MSYNHLPHYYTKYLIQLLSIYDTNYDWSEVNADYEIKTDRLLIERLYVPDNIDKIEQWMLNGITQIDQLSV